MKKYRVDYQVIFMPSGCRDHFLIIEAESYYRATEKFKKLMGRYQTRDSRVEMLKFELIREEQK